MMQIGFLRIGKSNVLKHMFFVFVSVVLIVGTFMPGHASELTLEYASGNLSATVSKVSLENLMEALSSKCDIKVFLDESIKSKKISTRFSNLPLEKAIERLVNPYSSALVFGKKRTPKGHTEFYVKEVKVYDSSNSAASYVAVGKKAVSMAGRASSQSRTTGDNRKMGRSRSVVTAVPPALKDPATAAAYKKEISSKMLQTRIAKTTSELQQFKRKMQYNEDQKRHRLVQLQQELKTAPKEDVKKIQAEISLLSADIKNSSQRNAAELKRLQTELDQMKYRFVDQQS